MRAAAAFGAQIDPLDRFARLRRSRLTDMSGDFELAVKFGATHVRVGTAIFGARPQTIST